MSNNASQLAFERASNKVQVSLKFQGSVCAFSEKIRNGQQYGNLPLAKQIYLNGNLAFSSAKTNLHPSRI